MKYVAAILALVIVGSVAVDAEAQLLRRNRCSSGSCYNSAAWGNSISCSSGPAITLVSTEKLLETGTLTTSGPEVQSPVQAPLQKPTQTSVQKSVAQKSSAPRERRLFRRRAFSRTFAIERTRSRSRG